jgi:hypothetical protein
VRYNVRYNVRYKFKKQIKTKPKVLTFLSGLDIIISRYPIVFNILTYEEEINASKNRC